ncbi:MAG: hypothetical protein JWN40_107 [Phycisphaerales bacterium]|nr:hypothetical protein [Phycisphaerales bacterium]
MHKNQPPVMIEAMEDRLLLSASGGGTAEAVHHHHRHHHHQAAIVASVQAGKDDKGGQAPAGRKDDPATHDVKDDKGGHGANDGPNHR